MIFVRSWLPTADTRRAEPPSHAKAAAAFVAGPPAEVTCLKAACFSLGPGTARTRYTMSTVVSPRKRAADAVSRLRLE
jgi:hypothetical protein